MSRRQTRRDDPRLDSRRARLLAACERHDVAFPTAAPDRELADALIAAAGMDPRQFNARSTDWVEAYATTADGIVQTRLAHRRDAGDPDQDQDPELAAAQAETAEARDAMIDRQNNAWQQTKEKH